MFDAVACCQLTPDFQLNVLSIFNHDRQRVELVTGNYYDSGVSHGLRALCLLDCLSNGLLVLQLGHQVVFVRNSTVVKNVLNAPC
jgi:hypothetical protein